MDPESVARIYVAAVELDDRAQSAAPQLAEETGILRAELHALLMQTLRENRIPFVDRADAARLAFELARSSSLEPRA